MGTQQRNINNQKKKVYNYQNINRKEFHENPHCDFISDIERKKRLTELINLFKTKRR